jgi:hypothetical protein
MRRVRNSHDFPCKWDDQNKPRVYGISTATVLDTILCVMLKNASLVFRSPTQELGWFTSFDR